MIPASVLGIVLLIVFLATLVRGTFGFGEALVAMPLLAFVIDLSLATPLVTLICLVISLVMLADEWRHLRLGHAGLLIVASFCGIPIGTQILVHVPAAWTKLLLAILVLVFAGYSLARPRLPYVKNRLLALPMGLVAGMLGGAYNTQGPPIVIYGALKHWQPAEFRATIQAFALPTGFAIVFFHAREGLVDWDVIRVFLMCLPVVFFAFLMGCKVRRQISTSEFARYVYYLLLACGAMLLINSLRALAS